MITEPFNHLIELAFAPLEGTLSATAPVGLLLLGLVTGLRHSMEADHVAAVSTIVATTGGKKRLRRAPLLGLMWGLGHTVTLFVAGLIVLLLAISIPEQVSGRLEFGVGLMLIFLGATTLTGFNLGKFLRGIVRRDQKHSHEHMHKESGVVHSHEHDHHNEHHHSHKSLIVGMIHGMAGSGALMLVVLSTISSIPLGLAYIAIFGAGSIASMAAMSALIGLPFSRAGNYRRTSLLLKYAAAIITLIIGVGLVYELGVVERVFL
jgi:high-affinity nickel permease